jgi:Ser-tRNA(Ala) deacylase AlaX
MNSLKYFWKFNLILNHRSNILKNFCSNLIQNMDLTVPATIKEFNFDTYKYELESKVVSFGKDEKDGNVEVVFERTIFHPQGGGQPSDEGFVILGNNIINVISLNYDKQKDIIKHKLDLKEEKGLKINDTVKMSINSEKRLLYARLHSAGHLVDMAVSKLGLKLKPGKGYHFPESPYVEYEGFLEEDKVEKNDKKVKNEGPKFSKIQESLQKTCNEIISSAAKDNSVQSKIFKYQDAKKDLELPSYLSVGSDIRWVRLLNDDPGCPCGGTHLNHISEIGKMTVTKIIKKKNNYRICYSLQ